MQGEMTAAVAEPVARDEPLLKVRELDKHFGPVQALYHVDLDIPSGQVTALCGDNGAGKTVLTKCIAGVYQADHGQVTWEGHPVHIRNARDAARLGIETVYQDLALADNLDIVQNMFLGRERLRPPKRWPACESPPCDRSASRSPPFQEVSGNRSLWRRR